MITFLFFVGFAAACFIAGAATVALCVCLALSGDRRFKQSREVMIRRLAESAASPLMVARLVDRDVTMTIRHQMDQHWSEPKRPTPRRTCARAPSGWCCIRPASHTGPCAALPLDGIARCEPAD